MAGKYLNPEQVNKMKQLVNEGMAVMQEVETLNGGLTDTVKAIAEELELKPGLINKAITVAHKGNYKNIADDMDTLESILNTAGKL